MSHAISDAERKIGKALGLDDAAILRARALSTAQPFTTHDADARKLTPAELVCQRASGVSSARIIAGRGSLDRSTKTTVREFLGDALYEQLKETIEERGEHRDPYWDDLPGMLNIPWPGAPDRSRIPPRVKPSTPKGQRADARGVRVVARSEIDHGAREIAVELRALEAELGIRV